MKANELRIGNLVYYLDGNGNFYQWDITVIENGITDDFEPIPLTEEWLEKFGFIKKQISGPEFFEKWVFKLFVDPKGFYLFIDHDYEYGIVEHVHQLQNLYFALTGEELIII